MHRCVDVSEDSTIFRFCKDCGEKKERNRENYRIAHTIYFDGICKRCRLKKEANKRRKKGIKKAVKKSDKNGFRICTKCGKRKKLSIENFFIRKRTANGKRYEYLSGVCRICHLENDRRWFAETYDKRRQYMNNYDKKRRNSDINYKLKQLIRRRISLSLKRGYKSVSTLELLGCSIEECRKNLELKFKKGMTWKNHGTQGWHIDHIKPLASFDLTIKEQQKEAFNYKNLQPLWAKDNLAKSDKTL